MQQDVWSGTDIASRFIDSPLIAIVLFGVAVATATILVRLVPSIRRTLATVEQNRHGAIDGLRGLLGVSVFIHHTVITWYFIHGAPWQLPPSRFIVHLGQSSVALFFMITAFLFWGRVLDRRGKTDWAEFFVSRLYRLYPVYLIMLALMLAVVFTLTGPSQPLPAGTVFSPLLKWLMFTMFGAPDLNGFPRTELLVAGVTWSLRYEWLFYCALPALGFLAGRSRQPLAALCSVVVVTAIFWRLNWHSFDPRIMLSFIGGIAAAHFTRNPRLAALARTPAAGLLAIVALSGVLVLMPTAYRWPATAGLSAFFIVVASGHELWGLLRLPGLLWLGDITYSIYLLQGFFLWVTLQWFWPRAIASRAPVFLGSILAIDIMLVLISSLTFLLIERPAILLGKRHYRRFRRTSARVG